MLSRREVFVRILGFLERRTLIETKNLHIKMLKMALFDCAINKKCCSVDGGRGSCPLFSSPPWGIWGLKSPHPWGICHPRQKMLMPGDQPGGGGGGGWWERAGRSWNWLMHYLRADFISKSLFSNHSQINIMYFNCSKVCLILLTKNCNCLDILKKTLHSFDDVRRWIERAAYNRRNMVTVTGRLIQSGLNTSQTVELR